VLPRGQSHILACGRRLRVQRSRPALPRPRAARRRTDQDGVQDGLPASGPCSPGARYRWQTQGRQPKLKPTISPHGLRRTWATWFYALTRDPLFLKAEGDWHAIAMVECYAHLMEEARARRLASPARLAGWSS
jgi:integrase